MSAPLSRRERWLAVLLRLTGAVTLLATGAVFLPTEWMAAVHGRLGLGAFPAAPVTEYLTRSLSLLYALIGALLWHLGSDPVGYRRLIRRVGGASIGAGLVLLGIDLYAGLPWWWTWHEGPQAVVLGALFLWLSAPERPRTRASPLPSAPGSAQRSVPPG